jgi:hypothetical protein
VTLLVAALALVALTGFEAPATVAAPSPSVSALPSPTATVDSTVAVIALSGSSLSTRHAAGTTIATVLFSEGPSAIIGLLTEALGSQPTLTPASAESMCIDPIRRYSWSNSASVDAAGVTVSERETPNPLRPDWTVEVRSASVAGIRLETSNGLTIGENTDAFVAALPVAQKAEYKESVAEGGVDTHSYIFDMTDTRKIDGTDHAYGGVAISDSSLFVLFGAPTIVNGFC